MNPIQKAYIIDDEESRREASARAIDSMLHIPIQQFESAEQAASVLSDTDALFVVNISALDNCAFRNVSHKRISDVPVIVTTCRNAYEVKDALPKDIKRIAYVHCPPHKTELPHHQKIRNALRSVGLLDNNNLT